MAKPTYEHDLGRLVHSHRPVPMICAFAISAVFCLPFPVLALFTPAGLVVAAVLLVLFAIPTYFFGEWFLLQHRIHEHGLVSRSLPGLPVYVIPYYTVNPDTLEVAGPWRRRSDEPVLASSGRQLRATWFQPTIWLTGLDPKHARRLAKGKIDWHTAGEDVETHGDRSNLVLKTAKRWVLSFRDPEEHRAILQNAVRASHRAYSYDADRWEPVT